MVAHHPDPLGWNRDIERQVAGLVTRIQIGLLHCDVVDGQETIGLTAHHVISGESHDALDVVAPVEVNGQHGGHRTPYPSRRRTLVGASSRSMIGEAPSAIEDDKV